MSDWQLAVPTRGYAQRIGARTLALVAAAGIPRERVTLYVADEQEQQRYAAALPAWADRLRVAAPGVMQARRRAYESYPEGARVLFVDDDVKALYRLDAGRLRPIALDAVAQEGFRAAAAAGAYLWGIYPVQNAYFMRERVRTELTFISGGLYGVTVRHEEALHPRLAASKEDYERSLRFYERDGVLARLDYICADWAYKPTTGDRIGRTPASVERNVQALEGRWPQYVRRGKVRAGLPEIRLHAPRARVAA